MERELKRVIKEMGIDAEHIHFEKSVKTVADAVEVSGVTIDEIIKTIIFKSPKGTVAAIVPARFRVSKSRLENVIGVEVEIASPKEILEMTGYPAGGVPCIGYSAMRVADPLVFEQEYVYTGGGSQNSLLKINTREIKNQNPMIARIRK